MGISSHKKRKWIVPILLILLLVVSFLICAFIEFAKSFYVVYPFEKADRWVCTEPNFVLEYHHVNGVYESNETLEINGVLQAVDVSFHAGIFSVFRENKDVDVISADEMLLDGTWDYYGKLLIVFIDKDTVFNGAYRVLVFMPEE